MTVSREAVQANVSERCSRLQQEAIDLLQFHWQLVSHDACSLHGNILTSTSGIIPSTSKRYNIWQKTSG
jgi:aryl-alcohol dehydrogenase-like predicted oxidoreductase